MFPSTGNRFPQISSYGVDRVGGTAAANQSDDGVELGGGAGLICRVRWQRAEPEVGLATRCGGESGEVGWRHGGGTREAVHGGQGNSARPWWTRASQWLSERLRLLVLGDSVEGIKVHAVLISMRAEGGRRYGLER